MEKVRPWCGQPSDRGRLRNRNRNIARFSGVTGHRQPRQCLGPKTVKGPTVTRVCSECLRVGGGQNYSYATGSIDSFTDYCRRDAGASGVRRNGGWLTASVAPSTCSPTRSATCSSTRSTSSPTRAANSCPTISNCPASSAAPRPR